MVGALVPRRAADDIDRAIGRNIRFHRILRGLTQAELGIALGVSYQQVQKYEQGASAIAVSRLADIARVLGVPLADFITPPSPGNR